MVRRPKQERSKATVDAILKAAAICVGEKGLNATSTRHIAKVAGVGVGSIYEYFEDKEAIFTAMHDTLLLDAVDFVKSMIPKLTKMDPQTAIRTLLMSFKDFLSQENELYLKLVQQSAGSNLAIDREPMQKVLTEFLVQYMMQNPEAAKVRNIPALSYILINGGMAAVVSFVADPNPPITFDELANTYALMISHYAAQEMLINS